MLKAFHWFLISNSGSGPDTIFSRSWGRYTGCSDRVWRSRISQIELEFTKGNMKSCVNGWYPIESHAPCSPGRSMDYSNTIIEMHKYLRHLPTAQILRLCKPRPEPCVRRVRGWSTLWARPELRARAEKVVRSPPVYGIQMLCPQSRNHW
jgi:hypothetical protein